MPGALVRQGRPHGFAKGRCPARTRIDDEADPRDDCVFSICCLFGSLRTRDAAFRNCEVVKGEQDYLTDAFAPEAADFIQRRTDQPGFVYVAFNAVHSHLEATEAYEARFPQITSRTRKTYAGMLSQHR